MVIIFDFFFFFFGGIRLYGRNEGGGIYRNHTKCIYYAEKKKKKLENVATILKVPRILKIVEHKSVFLSLVLYIYQSINSCGTLGDA